ncbi:MAG: BON domain-containing protein [Bacillota bacterium]|nr:BON domain-containing protein [Bacillota bacterium]
MANNTISISDKVEADIKLSMPDTSKDITISAVGDRIILTGFVNVLAEREKAEKIAKSTPGVHDVENHITISLDGGMSDKEAETLLNKTLKESIHADRIKGVSGKVRGGSALLIGSVECEADRKLALSEASKTFGIRTVVNNIEVVTKAEDVTIANKITDKLRLLGLDVWDVTCLVNKGKVVVNGYTKDEEEIKKIINAVEEIEGVQKVLNKLNTRDWYTGI